MPATVSHILSMTTPDNALYENKPSDWNKTHAYTFNMTGSEISNAFSNANGISFGVSAGAITGSYTVPSVTQYFSNTNTTFNGNLISGSLTHNTNGLNVSLNHPAWLTTAMASNAATISNIRVSAGTTSNLLSAVTFADSNGLAFGINGSTITGSYTRNVASNAIQSVGSVTGSGTNTSRFAADDHVHAGVFSFGVSTAGNTVGDTRVDVGRFILQGGNNVTLSQITAANALNTIVISGGAAGGADGVNAIVVNGGVSTASTTLTLSNSNNVSFGHVAGVITATATFAQTNQSAIRAFGVSNTGQTAGNTGVSTGIDWVLAGSQSLTLSQSTAGGGPNTVWIQHPAWLTTAMQSNAATLSNIRVSAGTTSNLLSAFTFGDANGVSFGINASTVTASVNGTGAIYVTAQSTGQSSSSTYDARSLSLIPDGIISAGWSNGSFRVSATQSNQNVTAANGGFAFQTLSFSNLNGISFGTSAGSAITASHNALTTARASNDAIGLNTAQTNVTWTVNSSGLSLNAAGYAGTGTSATNASITLNSNGLAISVAAGGGVTPVASASNGSFSFTTLGFSNANNVTFGTSAGSIITASVAAPGAAAENNWVNLLGANTAGNTTASGSTIGYSGINLTLSGTNNSVVNISAPATSSLVGASGLSISTNGSTISVYQVANSLYVNSPLFNSSALTWNGASVSHAVMFQVPEPISFAYLRFPGLMTTNSTTIATLASATASAQGMLMSSLNAVIYSLGVGANSRSLQSVTSGQGLYSFSQRISVTNSTQGSYSLGITQRVRDAQTTLSTQYSVSNTNYSFTTNQIATNFSSARYLDIPFAGSLPPGNYWLVAGLSTSSSSAGAAGLAALTNCNVRYSAHYGCSQAVLSMGEMGSTDLSSNAWMWAASFSTGGAGGTTNSIPISALTSMASQAFPVFQLARSA